MKAIVISEQGGPDNMVLSEVPEPEAGPGEVVAEVDAAGLNFVDVYQRSGLYEMELPFIPGSEGAGTVLSIGDDVSGIGVGDRIGWANVRGSYAEKSAIPADKAVPIPDGLDTVTVAAMLLQGITAHYLATDTFRLRPGHRCLIHAGAGGVGLLLTQIAKLKGAEVFTTVGSEEKAELSRKAGSDHVIGYSETDFVEAVEEICGPNTIDVVYDGVGASTFESSLDLLRPRGLMVSFGNASGPAPKISPLVLSQKGSLFLTRPTMAHYISTREELLGRCRDLFDWIRSGVLEVRIGSEYPLADAAEAHRALEGRRTTGKVLLRP
jgi:NADPH2:quinone reductase